MINAQEYINQTEHAVKSMFDCIDHYSSLMKKSIPPVKAFSHSGKEGEFERMYDEWRDQHEIQQKFSVAAQARKEYDACKFSMHVIFGSILQIACKGVEIFSDNDDFDDSISYLFERCSPKTKDNLMKFSFGRKVRGVPIGLIIYAGRNQYNHLEARGDLNQINKNIFKALAINHDYGGEVYDPGFDLNNELLMSFSSNVCSLLGWNSFVRYQSDVMSLIGNSSRAQPASESDSL